MTPTTFEQFLTVQRYRPLTVKTYAQQIARVRAVLLGGDQPAEGTRHAVKAYVKWLDFARGNEDAGDRAVRAWLAVPRLHMRGVRKGTPVAAFTEDDWRRLVEVLETDPEPEGRVLEVQTTTGLRIGDVLRLKRRPVVEALRSPSGVLTCEVKGGREQQIPVHATEDVWRRLVTAWPASADTVAQWLSPTSKDPPAAAYLQVRKHLGLLVQDLGIEGRANLHRIRHTVAGRALEKTHDVTQVQALLGHGSVTTTQRYLDERERIADIAKLHRAMRRDGV